MASVGIVSNRLNFFRKFFLPVLTLYSSAERDLPEYHTLEAWLQEQKSSIRVDDIEVVLGQTADQFFARNNNSYRWKGLHPALDAKLKNYSRDPSTKAHVALGLGTNFLLYDSDVLQVLWAVPAYPSLDSILADWNENTSEKGNITVHILQLLIHPSNFTDFHSMHL